MNRIIVTLRVCANNEARRTVDAERRSTRLCVYGAFMGCGLAIASCSGRRTLPPGDELGPQLADVARGQELAEGLLALPPRTETALLAGRIEAMGRREGAGTRAVQMHTIAGRLVERLWRVEGRYEDASTAIDDYRAASADVRIAGACAAALRGALLAGERDRNASVTYAELYRTEQRFRLPSADSGCLPDLERALARVELFRPPQGALDAIDEALAGQGVASLPEDASPPLTAPNGSPRILAVDSWAGPDAARVVVTLDRPMQYRAGDEAMAGQKSPRLFLDLDGVDVGAVPADTPQQGIVKNVHAEATSTGSRILVDLDQGAWRRIFQVEEPYRIVVDIARKGPPGRGHVSREVSRVVLDPGHGGRDTGAVGAGGVMEKEVVLDVAHRVAPLLVEQGIQVLLTRDDDRFVPLEERAARANAFGANLFVSIHCNASEGRGRRGVETYVLDATRDEIAARIAARENEMTPAASAELGTLLASMRLAEQAQQSAVFAGLLQRSAVAALGLSGADIVDGGVHFAGFYVLVGARMPSVLFETSYISNVVEEERLGSPQYRQRLADAIANAVKAYRQGR
jgi:N-acetylmuramoyl-L-alanine amidase